MRVCVPKTHHEQHCFVLVATISLAPSGSGYYSSFLGPSACQGECFGNNNNTAAFLPHIFALCLEGLRGVFTQSPKGNIAHVFEGRYGTVELAKRLAGERQTRRSAGISLIERERKMITQGVPPRVNKPSSTRTPNTSACRTRQ